MTNSMTKNAIPDEKTCPVDHSQLTSAHPVRKTAPTPSQTAPALEQDAHGTWHVHRFDLCRQILRSDSTRQAGFSVEKFGKAMTGMRDPILYLEGEAHHKLRSQTAKFFTPTTTQTKHLGMMQELTERLIGRLKQQGKADLSELSLELAVGVAAQVIGLTHSPLKGLAARMGILAQHPENLNALQRSLHLSKIAVCLFNVFWRDIRPAIVSRRRNPQNDVISHILALGYQDHEILGECVTYGAAGMLTTREFISVTAWHLLERPALKARYLVAGETERHAILAEILRLEPVIASVKRRSTQSITLEVDGTTQTIPEGALLHLHIYSANADPSVVGQDPHDLCPQRPLPKGVQEPIMSFGDGHHRCPGSFLAFAETDVFLRRLLALPIVLESKPTLSFNTTLDGYEIRNIHIRLERV
jgi:cytochrome P450